MFGHKKSPLNRFSKHRSADTASSGNPHSSNPFDSHDEQNNKQKIKPSGRTTSDPSLVMLNSSSNPWDDEETKGAPSSQSFFPSNPRNKYKNDFRDSGGLESQTVEDLEDYAVYKAEETTKSVNSCLKLAEEMREDATKTLVTLHHQGEQITRTHMAAADIDHDLSKGEKLLGSLGGMFSKTWKPHKNRSIAGPVIMRDDPVRSKGNHLNQRERLGLSSGSKERSNTHTRTPPPEPTNALQKVEVEKGKQDDALNDLSNILDDLKDMAVDMGSEFDRQKKALDGFEDDADEMVYRVNNANRRTRHLIGK